MEFMLSEAEASHLYRLVCYAAIDEHFEIVRLGKAAYLIVKPLLPPVNCFYFYTL